MIVPPVFSQAAWPGVGDLDECWGAATVWAALAADPSIRVPTATEWRAAAHRPDQPGPTGGTIDDIMRAATTLWPELTIERYDSSDWGGFATKIRAGYSASLAVMSSALPSRLQFGFRGTHQVGVAMYAGWRLMNPLAANGATTAWIEETELRTAARAYDRGIIRAALFAPHLGGRDAMIAAGGIRLTSDKRARVTTETGILKGPGGTRLAKAKVGYVYPYLGASGGYRAVLVQTALPYEDHQTRPTVLYIAANAVAIEDVPDTAGSPTVVTLQITGHDPYSVTL